MRTRLASWWSATRARLGRVRRRVRGDVTRFEDSAINDEAAETDVGSLFVAHSGRLAYKWAHYFGAYSEHFARYRGGFPVGSNGRRPLRLLEIGVYHGGSLQLWRKYFGDDAIIYGVDIDPRCAAIDDPDFEVRIGSQADPLFLTSVVSEMGGVDIVIDDGSHVSTHQRMAFSVLFPMLTDGGIYVVEDLHTSYWLNYRGGLGQPGFLRAIKDMIDDMHVWYHEKPNRFLPLGQGIRSVAVYDSIAFIHKCSPFRPTLHRVGEPSF